MATITRIFTVVMLALCSLTSRADSWRLHATYDGSLSRIVATPDYTYFLSYAQPLMPNIRDFSGKYLTLFRYNNANEEFENLDATGLLSENIVANIQYNPDKGYLMVVYPTGNIDLLYDNGKVVNIPGMMMANDYDVTPNTITFYPAENLAYIGTPFGYVAIDDEKGEVHHSRNFAKNLTAVARLGDMIIVGNAEGLYYGPAAANSFYDLKQLDGFTDVRRLHPLGSRLYVLQGADRAAKLSYLTLQNGVPVDTPWQTGIVTAVEPYKEGMIVISPEPIRMVNGKTYEHTNFIFQPEDVFALAGGWNGSDFWISRGRKGLAYMRADRETGSTRWTTLRGESRPNASAAFKSDALTYSPQYGMLVRNHGINWNFTSHDAPVSDLLSVCNNLEWKPIGTGYTDADHATFYNPNGAVIDPNNPNHVYAGSFLNGILRQDLSDPANVLHMTHPSDPAAGKKGYVKLVDDLVSWKELCSFSRPAFDSRGYMWTAYHNLDKNKDGQYAEFYYWSPEARAASTSPATFRKPGVIGTPVIGAGSTFSLLPLKYEANKNLLVYYEGIWNARLLIYDHNGTYDSTSDDRKVVITRFTDQDGNVISPEYIYCIYEDPSTGNVWISTNEGMLYINPRDQFNFAGTATRPKVNRNDGTNLADYLLTGVGVNAILDDNSGRKWFGTRGGGLVCTSSDGRTVYNTYTADNTPLPDDLIYGMALNPAQNSLMVSTDKGLAELFFSGSGGGQSESEVRAYPNPVRPEYYGYVTIDGLQEGAIVKIVDAGGNMVKELGYASGGTLEWDLTNLNHKTVPPGVYHIFASSGPSNQDFAAAGKILVIR